jgi:hypothetical protein
VIEHGRGYGLPSTILTAASMKKVSSEGYYIVGLLAEAFLEKNPGRRLSTTRACPGTPWMW